ncbi:MAG: FtsX-like permease family protein [Streptosporangiaceae bacterium]|nr:FtsX-like permease family protein [Streptosporangiaceae bacterium]
MKEQLAMGVVWYRLRADLRGRWRTLVLIAVLVGIGGGVALTAFAGARRTAAAVPQMLAYSRPDDGSVVFGYSFCPPPRVAGPAARSLAPLPAAARVLRLPEVAAFMRSPYLFFSASTSGADVGSVNVTASADVQGYRAIDRPLMAAGRFPDPRRPFDAAINDLAAERLHLGVGSRLTLYAYSQAQVATCHLTVAAGGPPAPAGPRFTVRVVGIARLPSDVNAIAPLAAAQNVDYDGQGQVYLTPTFLSRYAAALGIPVQDVTSMNAYFVRVHGGPAGWNAFAAAAARLDPAAGLSAGGGDALQVAAASAEQGTHLEAVALLLFGALAGLVTLLLAGQALARQVLLEEADLTILAGLGMTGPQVVALVVLRAALTAVAGGLLAVAAAVAASPLMPVGLARQADISPGISADAVVLTAGFFAIVALLAAAAALPAWRVSRRVHGRRGESPSPPGAPWLGGWLAHSPLPLTTMLGVRFGLARGRGRTAVPAGTALAGAAAAVIAVAAALTFGASLAALVGSPWQQGWNWDVLAGNPNTVTDPTGWAVPRLAGDPLVGSYSALTDLSGGFTVDGAAVDNVLVFDPLKGAVFPPLLDGRPPRTPGEIVLGSSTLRQIGRQVGQTVKLATPAGTTTMRVVGRMIVPSVGDILTNGLGQGAWVPDSYFQRLKAEAARLPDVPPLFYQLFAVRYAPDVPPAKAFTRLQHDFGPAVLRHIPGANIVNLQSVDGLPLVLAGLAALIGAAAVGNTMTVFVRRRRRDLALLKTLGLRKRQIAGIVAWQATSFMLAALALGLPLGVAAGRWAWDLEAAQLQSAAPPAVPALAIALMVPAALLAGNALAAMPARSAARTAPATSLRQE